MRRSVRVACALAVWALATVSPLSAAEGSTRVRRVSNFPARAGDQRGAPSSLLALGNEVLYVSSYYGELRLWASDGTASGTRLVRELCSSCDLQFWVAHGPVAFLRILDHATYPGGESLWRSDGTIAGTYPLTAPLPALDPWSSLTPNIVPAGALVYAMFGDGLWSSDGTVAGTQLLDDTIGATTDLVAWGDEVYLLGWRRDTGEGLWRASRQAGLVELRSLPSCEFYPTSLVRAGERLFFVAEKSGRELWTSDGTAAGTVPATDFRTPEALVDLTVLTPLGSRVWFQANEGKQGWQLWSSDGTPAGTKAATAFRGPRRWGYEYEDAEPAWPGAQLVRLGGRTLFAAAAPSGDEAQLWTTNGDPASTARMHGCAGGCPLLFESDSFAVLGDRAAFFGYRPPDYETSLWITDGTGAGTVEIPLAQDCEDPSFVPLDVVAVGGRWFFTAAGALWATDGTQAGTVRLAAFSEYLSLRTALAATPNGVSFAGVDERGAIGLWQTAGAGAREILTPPSERDSDVSGLIGVAGNRVLLEADGGCWSADAAGLALLPAAVSNCGGDYKEVAVVGGRLFVVQTWESRYGDRKSFWSTDGTPEGTTPIDLEEADVRSNIVPWDGGRLALYASEGGLWTSDGTAAGTALLVPVTGYIYSLEVAGGRVVFTVDANTASTTRLWSSDGTAAGTRPISPVWDSVGVPRVLGDRVYVLAQEPHDGPLALWSMPVDGGAAESLPLSAIGASGARALTTAARRLWFAATISRGNSYRSWLFTAGGTLDRLRWLPVDLSEGSWQLPLLALGGNVFLASVDAAHGRELWRTDGTAAGTALVRDVAPGLADGSPANVVAWRGRLFFTADDGAHGRELWSTDGTDAGTRLEVDIAPGPRGSHPANLMVAGDRLYFTANDGETGWQLWTIH